MSGRQHKRLIKRSLRETSPSLDSLAPQKNNISAIENFSDEEGVEDDCSEDDVPLATLRFEDGESSESGKEAEDITAPINLSGDWRWKTKSQSFPNFQFLFKTAEGTNVLEPYSYFQQYLKDEFLNKTCRATNLEARHVDIIFTLSMNKNKLRKFPGVTKWMSLIKLPQTNQHWFRMTTNYCRQSV